ncbi:hypothetical protein RND71_032355 [Anisodus tanguticus]|uniref:Uncharacterized protein n=1 Tax=Anisodus tanguticus TaxID=243964 RepID=A0AAE1V6P4_9SOLA|nr:hypothetical protein RND71_032355 [Anisodus tanguticus]
MGSISIMINIWIGKEVIDQERKLGLNALQVFERMSPLLFLLKENIFTNMSFYGSAPCSNKCWKFVFDGEVRPPIFNELNTRIPHVGGFVSSHVHNLLSE